MAEKRHFSVHPQIIYNLVVAQAGTLAKAILECVMNSVDAGATKVDIQIDHATCKITDDGQGFRTRKEIEDWFEVFGFPHSDGDRIYGKFGIGRAQLWSFCRTTWRTTTFQMDVDIKNRGLDYDLREGLPSARGVDIAGTFYTPLTFADVQRTERELAMLAKYSQIPVTVNGKLVNRDPKTEKWDDETPEAWMKFSDSNSAELSVYNLGVLVRTFKQWDYGIGGTIVTKPGVKLHLNMARNDILESQCEVWREIRKTLKKHSQRTVKSKSTRLSEEQVKHTARQLMAREMDLDEVREIKLIKDITGRSHVISYFLSEASGCGLVFAPKGSRIGEEVHRVGTAWVIHPDTLDRFGVETVQELVKRLRNVVPTYMQGWIDRMRVYKSLTEAAPTISEENRVIPDSKLTKEQRAAVRTLQAMSYTIFRHLKEMGLMPENSTSRTIRIGQSDAAEAWTDGHREIIFEERQAEKLKNGVDGFFALATLTIHEYLHDTNDAGSHAHDEEFYFRFHEALCTQELRKAAFDGFRKWIMYLRKHGMKIPRTVLNQMDFCERTAIEGGAVGEASIHEESIGAVAEAANSSEAG